MWTDQLTVDWGSPNLMVLALLLLGHVLADFVFRTESNLAKKEHSLRALARRMLVVALTQGVIVLWFSWSLIGLLLVLALALTHGVVRELQGSLDKRFSRHPLAWFLLGQAAHFGALLLALSLWPIDDNSETSAISSRLALVLSIIIFNANGGATIVGKTLEALQKPGQSSQGPKGAGKRIGVLERWIILALVWAGQWSAVGLVLTAKSIARFKKMDEQEFAEIYLVGTMTSVLIAMLSGGLLQLIMPLPPS